MINKNGKKVFVFDIETVPDVDVVKDLCAIEGEKTILELRESLRSYHSDNYNNDFPRQLFHKVITISGVLASEDYDDEGEKFFQIEKINTIGGDVKEQKIISDFINTIERYNKDKPKNEVKKWDDTPATLQLVSFNGRGFDIPVIKYRALKYGLSCPMLFDYLDQRYSNRYSNERNLDLLEYLSDFRSSAPIKLKEVSILLGIPCKSVMEGSEVSNYYDKGKIKDINDYCEQDAVGTYLLFLRCELLAGHITLTGYKSSINSLELYINKAEQVHLKNFMEEIKEINGFICNF